MKFYLAPLEGVTGYIFRNALEKYFPGTDRYFTPFIVPDQKRTLRTKELRDILPENNRVKTLIPQILTNDADRFREAVQALRGYGYEEVNLNLGCPSGTVVSRRRGAGLLGYPEELERFLDRIFAENDVRISIKTRIGMESPEEAYRLIEIYNQYPLSELIIHPRTRNEFYRGEPHLEIYEAVLPLCQIPVCYNGNLMTVRDYDKFRTSFAQTECVMLGRGVIANPGLIRELADGETVRAASQENMDGQTRKSASEGSIRKTQKQELHRFHDEIFEQYRIVFESDKNAIFRMKELWMYLLHLFAEAEQYGRKIRKAETLAEYRCEVNRLFRECELCTNGPAAWHLSER